METIKAFFVKTVLFFSLLPVLTAPLFGQDNPIEKLMTRRYLSCTDILYNVSFLIPEYYEKGNRDTIRDILAFWKERCNVSEEYFRCSIILSIDDGTFTEDLYDSRIFDILNGYRRRYNFYYGSYRGYGGYGGYGDYNPAKIDKFTNNLSTGILFLRKNLLPVEKFFLYWYSDDFDKALAMLDSDELEGTKIQDMHLAMKKKEEQSVFWHSDLMAGVWIPSGNLAIVGTHPFLGFRLGAKYRKPARPVR